MLRHVLGLMLLAVAPAAAQSGPATPGAPVPPAGEGQLKFHPVTQASDPVGIIYASRVPGGCLLVFGANTGSGGSLSRGGAFVPGQGCPRAVATSPASK